MLRSLFLLFFFFSLFYCRGQDSTASGDSTGPEVEHDPKKAMLRSAVLPGWGQAYNDKYWKIPIVYAGIGGSAYFLRRNQRQFERFKEAYLARNDGDPNTVDNEFKGVFSDQQLLRIQDQYRRWRDLSTIFLVSFYVLNILDASVDAYLYDFDVSDDLSMRVTPFLGPKKGMPRGYLPERGIRVVLKL